MTVAPGLAGATVVVIGCGGLGVPAAWALAVAGVGRLRLVDDDVVEVSNLHRQVLYGVADVGQPKAEVLARALQSRAPGLVVEVRSERCEGVEGVAALLEGADGLLEGTDDAAQKFAACDGLVAAAADRGGAAGPVGVIAAAIGRRGQWFGQRPGGACFRCLFEAPPPPAAVASCRVAGVLGPVALEVGALAARSLARLLIGRPDAADGALVRLVAGRYDRIGVAVAAGCGCALGGLGARGGGSGAS